MCTFQFTFHNVSINTLALTDAKSFLIYLHSTMFLLIPVRLLPQKQLSRIYIPQMFLLIQYRRQDWPQTNQNLHSTMFLLIPRTRIPHSRRSDYLHSTMFLLILMQPENILILWLNLHSTMFLLILLPVHYIIKGSEQFTFHNVSINTTSHDWRKEPVISIYIPQCFY